LSIGREPVRDIQIVDPKVSRKHAIVRFGEAGHLIAPVKALNGLIINGTSVDVETLLNDGDEITLGDTVLRYTADANNGQTNAVFHQKNVDRPLREDRTMVE
jgi:pSer/pThr/pTyr-binding forkhead associated (FHA) protein